MLESLDCEPVTETKKRLPCGESTLSSLRRGKQGVVKERFLCHRHVPAMDADLVGRQLRP